MVIRKEVPMKSIIISDIHGCSLALKNLLARLPLDKENDRLILLGDLFDRGPDSYGVYQIVQKLAEDFGDRFVLIRGNHEDYLLTPKLSFGMKIVWKRVGKNDSVKSFKANQSRLEDTIPWLNAHVVNYYRGDGFQCVHAGLRKDPIEENSLETMVHDHQVVMENQYSGPLTIVGHIALEKPAWFAGDGRTYRNLKENVWQDLPDKGFICIDAGCGKGGRLVGMIIENGRFLLRSVDENG